MSSRRVHCKYQSLLPCEVLRTVYDQSVHTSCRHSVIITYSRTSFLWFWKSVCGWKCVWNWNWFAEFQV